MNYQIILKYSHTELQEEVNKKIEEGYYPIGGVSSIFSETSGFAFVQAIMLPIEEDKN